MEKQMITQDQIISILSTFGMLCDQGLVVLQMAAHRCVTRFGNLNERSLSAMFQVMIEDISIEEPRPLPSEIPEIATGSTTSSNLNKVSGSIMGIAGLPLGVRGKKMKVLGIMIPESAITSILKLMFNGDVFKSRDMCPVISEILDNNGIVDTPEDIEYHIACRLVTTHKQWFDKQGVKYQYVQ